MALIALTAIGAVFLAQATADEVDPERVSIPAAYLGKWAPSLAACKDQDGTEVVTIAARQLHYYEATGVLRLAQLNEASDPAELLGSFDFVGEGRFWRTATSLKLVGDKLVITESLTGDPEKGVADPPLMRCPGGK